MKKEAMSTRHPLRRSPGIIVVDTAPKTETGAILPLAASTKRSLELSLQFISVVMGHFHSNHGRRTALRLVESSMKLGEYPA